VAWDCVAGVLFGLLVMWVVFDQLGGVPAGRDVRAVNERNYKLGTRINGSFERVRQLGEGVMLEFGPLRAQHLALRARMLERQLQLRLILIARVALFKDRLRPPVLAAQRAFDERHAAMLEGMADRLEGKAAAGAARLRTFLALARRMDGLVVELGAYGPGVCGFAAGIRMGGTRR
jgi:multidrug resistance protein MdtO